ncbi:MAG TPA: valine--tRNA ligase [Gammaproteobacteria bacterium]|nr:valine--tRNA ligase [Gammaproteobacteria bacterium]
MKKEYRPAEIEARHYERWEQAGWFAPSGRGEPYCIVIPPPNVTGTLHMGHALQDTIMDALTRYHRMRGRNTLWQPGTDHAGIATQMVVERLLEREGTSRKELGRERFLERVWQWKERSGNTIVRQMRRLGASVDWSRERFTMDAELSRAVGEVFVRLYEEGLIYRGKRLVNWDPVLRTAVSDLEVLSTEEKGKLWHLRYPIEGASGAHLVVATTRPETMLGDTAVAVHPEDERYQRWVGKHVRLPLADRLIPVIADEYVDREFGTGVVKITPAHDFNDYEVGQRHNLPLIGVLDDTARLNDAAPARYRGLDRFVARERVLEDLTAAGLLEKVEDHVSKIPRGDRSGVVVEPLLTDQWYVKTKPLAEPAIAAVEDGRVRFVPDNWKNTYFEWMRNIQDWCISRQLWWGHRIPAWYDDQGNVYVARDEAEARAKHGLGAAVKLRQDDDVLDTWFSSALWPFSTLGWPDKTPALATFYPTNVLVTSFDIIFFWVARMIMLGMKFAGDVPFREVYIHALVRDHEGQKMSKSKGNILDPLDLIDGVDLETLLKKRTEGLMQTHLQAGIERVTRKEFPSGIEGVGTDALRLTFASLATTGRDARFDLARAEGFHRFCNKLWNASSYVLSQLGGTSPGAAELGVADRWILSRLHVVIREVHANYATYRLDLVAQVLYDFTWHELCDWYLELTKAVLGDPNADDARKRGTQQTLVTALGALLKMLHPLIPFVTEELWLELCKHTGRDSATVMLEPFPVESDAAHDAEAESEIDWLKSFVIGIRQIRGDSNLPRSTALNVQLADATATDRERVERHRAQLERLAGIARIEILAPGTVVKGAATALLGGMRILVPLAGLIDVASERDRLGKQLARTRDDLAKSRRKLDNQSFVANAPADVVEKENARVADFEQRAAQLEQQLARLADLQ